MKSLFILVFTTLFSVSSFAAQEARLKVTCSGNEQFYSMNSLESKIVKAVKINANGSLDGLDDIMPLSNDPRMEVSFSTKVTGDGCFIEIVNQ